MTHDVTLEELVEELVAAGHALYRAQLVTAFGHLSCRTAGSRWLITPPMPLGRLGLESEFSELDPDADELPVGVPREAWIHLAIADRRPEWARSAGPSRRSPPRWRPPMSRSWRCTGRARSSGHRSRCSTTPASSGTGSGHTSWPRNWVRGPRSCSAATARSPSGSVGEAVARMWVLEASARLNSAAAAAGTPRPLSAAEQAKWSATDPNCCKESGGTCGIRQRPAVRRITRSPEPLNQQQPSSEGEISD